MGSGEENGKGQGLCDLLGAGRAHQAGTHSERFLFSEKTRRMNSPS